MTPTSFSDVPKANNEKPRGDYMEHITESQSWSRDSGQQQVLQAGDKDINKKPTWE